MIEWLFQWDDSKFLCRKWLEITKHPSTLNWLFGVPGLYYIIHNITLKRIQTPLAPGEAIKATPVTWDQKREKIGGPGRGVATFLNRILKGGVVIPLIFPKVPQSSLGILRVPQLPPPLGHHPPKNPIIFPELFCLFFHNFRSKLLATKEDSLAILRV